MNFSKEEVLELCLKSMDKGMSLRQSQLSGYGPNKSGKEILEEWFEGACKEKEQKEQK